MNQNFCVYRLLCTQHNEGEVYSSVSYRSLSFFQNTWYFRDYGLSQSEMVIRNEYYNVIDSNRPETTVVTTYLDCVE